MARKSERPATYFPFENVIEVATVDDGQMIGMKLVDRNGKEHAVAFPFYLVGRLDLTLKVGADAALRKRIEKGLAEPTGETRVDPMDITEIAYYVHDAATLRTILRLETIYGLSFDLALTPDQLERLHKLTSEQLSTIEAMKNPQKRH